LSKETKRTKDHNSVVGLENNEANKVGSRRRNMPGLQWHGRSASPAATAWSQDLSAEVQGVRRKGSESPADRQ
jgi:hypothetical protein